MAETINLVLNTAAGGTVDAITLTYSPAITAYTDKRILAFRSAGANTSTTPTVDVNTLGAKTIVKNGGSALVAGDIGASGSVHFIQYDSANNRFELMNPVSTSTLNPTTNNVGKKAADGTLDDSQITDDGTTVKFTHSGGSAIYGFQDIIGTVILSTYLDPADAAWIGTKSNHPFYIFTNDGSAQAIFRTDKNFALPQQTGSRIAIFDANSNVVFADTSTYPSLTELSYVKGVTSAIQTQISNIYGGDIILAGAALNPADATTYYMGLQIYNIAPPTTADTRRFFIRKSCTIVAADVLIAISGSPGSSEASTMYVRVNNTTDTTISSAITHDAVYQSFNNTALNISISAGDYIELKWTTPTWVTNPTSVQTTVKLYIR